MIHAPWVFHGTAAVNARSTRLCAPSLPESKDRKLPSIVLLCPLGIKKATGPASYDLQSC